MTALGTPPTGAGAGSETRTERRKRETHRRLLDAVLALIMAEGQPGLTTRSIANHADVAVGTFYNHFEDVDAAIDEAFAPLRRKFDTWVGMVTESDNPMRTGCEVVALFLRDVETEPDLWRASRRAGWNYSAQLPAGAYREIDEQRIADGRAPQVGFDQRFAMFVTVASLLIDIMPDRQFTEPEVRYYTQMLHATLVDELDRLAGAVGITLEAYARLADA